MRVCVFSVVHGCMLHVDSQQEEDIGRDQTQTRRHLPLNYLQVSVSAHVRGTHQPTRQG